MAYHQLIPQERYLISHLRQQGFSKAQFTIQTGRHRSPIGFVVSVLTREFLKRRIPLLNFTAPEVQHLTFCVSGINSELQRQYIAYEAKTGIVILRFLQR